LNENSHLRQIDICIDRDTPVEPWQADAQTKSKQNTHESPPDGIINPYSHHYQPNATIWDHYLKQSEAEDKALTELLQVAPDQLLLFVCQLLPSFPYIVLN